MGRVYEDDTDEDLKGGPEEGPATSGAGEIAEKGFVKESKTPSFKEAFAAARKGGEKTFEWNGKKYGTELAKPKPKNEGMSMTRMDPEKAEDIKKRIRLEEARDTALRTAEGQRAVAAHKAKQARQKEANIGASMGGYKSGGKVSASSRGDGIAQRGKTRGKLC